MARARQDINVANPLDDERAMARLIVDGSDRTLIHQAEDPVTDMPDRGRISMHLGKEAAAEAARLSGARMFSEGRLDRHVESVELPGTLVTVARLRTTRIRLRGAILVILRVEYEDGHGRTSHWSLVPMLVAAPHPCRRMGHTGLRRVLSLIAPDLRAHAESEAASQGGEVESSLRAFAGTRMARELAIAESLTNRPVARLQPGLFDRRAELADLIRQAAFDEAAEESARRIAACERGAQIVRRGARIMLILLP
jgi:hypothetical protein